MLNTHLQIVLGEMKITMGCLLALLLTLCALTTFGQDLEHDETEDNEYDYSTDSSAAVNGRMLSETDWLITRIEKLNQLNPCRFTILCANGGRCENTANANSSYTCHCQEPFTGKTCRQVKNYCTAEKCGHGSCIFKPSDPYYECECKHPYGPPDCKTERTCMPNPCQNGGTCLNENDANSTNFQCSCPSGYTGKFCEVGPNDCYEEDGASYRGSVSVTVDGDECLNWNSYFILQKLRSTYAYSGLDGLGPHNFCRNPNEDLRPWCFIKHNDRLERKYCNVRQCPTETHPISPPASATDPTTSFSQCGKPQLGAGSRILFGNRAVPGVHPWQVSLQKRPNASVPFRHNCGGTLLNSCWVLTAAHCLHDDQERQVVLGRVDLKKHEVFDQIIPVEKFIVHEDYDRHSIHNDIALLKLTVMDEPFCAKETRFVKAACLPDQPSQSGTECMISGWGMTETRVAGTKHLMEAPVLLISQEQCSDPNVYGEMVHDSMTCAGYLEGGVNSCKGDSGGPLACERNGTHYVEGVVSWSVGCGQKKKPAVYTNVSKFINWIKNHMNS